MKRILGVDYGASRIGLALGVGDIVEPYTTLRNKQHHLIEMKAIENVAETAMEEEVQAVVIGLPLLHGAQTSAGKDIRHFGGRVAKLLEGEKIKVVYVDESKSSKEAVLKAVEGGIARKKRRNDHALAACQIIKRYLQLGPIE